MYVQIAKDRNEWNSIVDRNPHSVLHHRYEVCVHEDNALPLIIKEENHRFLFPLKIVKLLGSFRLAVSPIYYHASLLADTNAFALMPKALGHVTDFLRGIQVNYLCSSAPTFLSKQYAYLLDQWFRKQNASVQIIYAHMIHTENVAFEDIWRHRVRKRTREEIRKARREGVNVVRIDTVDDIREWMKDIHQCNISALKRQGRWGAYPDSYKEVFLSELISSKELLKEHFNIYGAVYRGHLIAYMIFQEYNGFMALSKAASHTKFLVKHPNDVLIAYVLKEACEKKVHWLEYTFDRVRYGGKIPSLHSGIRAFKRKFGFEDVPIPIYRLGLTRSGRTIQRLYTGREYIITRGAYIPKFVRSFFLRFYAPRRRRLSVYLHV